MIPLRDNIPPRRFPWVNYAIIALTTLAFLGQLREGEEGEALVERYGMIPARVMDPDQPIVVREVAGRNVFGVVVRPRVAASPPFTPWLTLLTCIFLHGGILHFLGNMWFLHIFGDNVEDRFGHAGYLVFYLLAGVAASLVHLFTNLASTIPTIGASGAIAGVMGSYFLLYPRARVVTLVPLVFIFEILVLPAPLFLGIWFLLQFVQALPVTGVETGGVAWWAHVGGFAAGLLIAYVLGKIGFLNARVDTIRPHTDHVTHYRVHPW